VAHPVPGLVIVAGGKYTTYRVMAADAVDVVVEELGRPAPPSWTDRLPIAGAEGYAELWEDRAGLASRTGLPLPRVEHLLQRYGTRIWNLLDLIKDQPDLGSPLPGAAEYLRAEAVYAVSHEGALHLEDVLTRRTRISIEERDRGVTAAPVVAGLMAPLLGWDAHRVDREVANYLARVEAERSAQEAPDDAAANATRLAAPALLPS
jgi:glycerol-3-phosphate dehydrogenase